MAKGRQDMPIDSTLGYPDQKAAECRFDLPENTTSLIGTADHYACLSPFLNDLGFIHDSTALDDDLPYWAQCSEGRRILVLHHCFDTNDMRYWYPNGDSAAWALGLLIFGGSALVAMALHAYQVSDRLGGPVSVWR
jgi:hypothetical protein